MAGPLSEDRTLQLLTNILKDQHSSHILSGNQNTFFPEKVSNESSQRTHSHELMPGFFLSSSLMAEAAEQQGLAIARLDTSFHIRDCNRTWLQRFPGCLESKSKLPWANKDWDLILRRALHGERLSGNQHELMLPNHESVLADWEVIPQYDGSEVTGTMVVTRISETPARSRREQMESYRDEARFALQKVDLVLKASHSCIFEWSLNTDSFVLSPGGLEMFEFDPQIGGSMEGILTMLPDSERERFLDGLKALNLGLEEFVLSFPILLPSGKRHHFEAHCVKKGGVGNQNGVILGLLRDVTDQFQLAHSREESQQKLRAVFDGMYQFIGLLSADGILLDANQTALDFGGMRPEDIIGKPFWQAHWWQVNEDTVNELKEAICQAAGGKLIRYDVEVQGANDQRIIIDFSLKPILNEQGEVIYIIPEGRDITELRKTREELELVSLRLESFMNHTPVVAWIKDEDFRFRYINPVFEKDLDTTREFIYGKNNFEFFGTGETGQQLQANDEWVLENREPIRVIEHVPMKNGTFAYSLVYKFPVGLENGKTGVGGVAMDITSQIEAEKQLEEANRKLQQVANSNRHEADQAKGELTRMAYTIAHDLRAPLRHIIAFIRILEEELEQVALTEDQRHYMGHISLSSARMATMIDELLEYARTDRQELSFSEVDLNSIIGRIQGILHTDFPTLNVDVGQLPVIHADKRLIEIAFQNLLENAAKFTSTRSQPQVSISANQQGDFFHITIADNGVGFNNAYKAKLFQLFQRLHPQDEFPGTGIGLANVHQIVLRHDGYIQASGKEGEGAVFTMGLPIRQKDASKQ